MIKESETRKEDSYKYRQKQNQIFLFLFLFLSLSSIDVMVTHRRGLGKDMELLDLHSHNNSVYFYSLDLYFCS